MKTLFTFLILFLLSCNLIAQWNPQNSGTTQDLYSVSIVSKSIVWACGNGGVVIRTKNGGSTWGNVSSLPVTGPLYNICAIDSGTALVTTSSSNTIVWKTINGGINWSQVFTQPGGFINVIEIQSSGIGIMQGDPVGGRWSLWKTTDYGTTWDSTGMYLPQAGSEAGWNNSIFSDGIRYYFGTNNSRIYYSSDSGTNWQAQSTPEANLYSVWFFNQHGYAGGTGLVESTNNGANWMNAAIPGTGNISGIVGYGPFYWLARGNNFLRIHNGGGGWQIEYTATDIINDIDFAYIGSGLYAVGNSGIIYFNPDLAGINITSNEIPQKYSLSQNYPNPFNPSTKINFDIVRAGFVSVKVYNSIGQEVAQLVNQEMAPGSYQADFDGAALTSGIYFYRIEAGDFVQTRKMMLIK